MTKDSLLIWHMIKIFHSAFARVVLFTGLPPIPPLTSTGNMAMTDPTPTLWHTQTGMSQKIMAMTRLVYSVVGSLQNRISDHTHFFSNRWIVHLDGNHEGGDETARLLAHSMGCNLVGSVRRSFNLQKRYLHFIEY